MVVRELIELLKEEDQDLPIYVTIIGYDDDPSNTYGPVTSVEPYEDQMELWIR